MKGWQNNHWLGLIKFKVDNAKWSWCIERHETKLQWCGYGWVCSVYVTSSRWDKVHNETESDGHAWNGFLFIGGFHIRHLAKLAIGLLLLPMQGLNMMHNRKARMRCLCGQLFSGVFHHQGLHCHESWIFPNQWSPVTHRLIFGEVMSFLLGKCFSSFSALFHILGRESASSHFWSLLTPKLKLSTGMKICKSTNPRCSTNFSDEYQSYIYI